MRVVLRSVLFTSTGILCAVLSTSIVVSALALNWQASVPALAAGLIFLVVFG